MTSADTHPLLLRLWARVRPGLEGSLKERIWTSTAHRSIEQEARERGIAEAIGQEWPEWEGTSDHPSMHTYSLSYALDVTMRNGGQVDTDELISQVVRASRETGIPAHTEGAHVELSRSILYADLALGMCRAGVLQTGPCPIWSGYNQRAAEELGFTGPTPSLYAYLMEQSYLSSDVIESAYPGLGIHDDD